MTTNASTSKELSGGGSKGANASRVYLAGNPNCGKTTLFNVVTGHRYKVANYPGVTVERKEGRLKLSDHNTVEVIDLPGIYSLSGQSEDERVAEESLRSARAECDLVLAVVDASNLERNLFLVSELIDLGLPIVLALNMCDIAERDGTEIREILLERELGVPVIPVTASKRKGIDDILSAIADGCGGEVSVSAKQFAWANSDPELLSLVSQDAAGGSAEEAGQVATERYRWINEVIRRSVLRKESDAQRMSDRVDGVVLHPVGGLLIFVTLMALLFQAVFSWASLPMDFIDGCIVWLGEFLQTTLPEGDLQSLLVNGVLAGVGSVVIFVPQIAILFFLIGLLEDSGYLCRAAFLMDRFMRQVGLQGRSFIPLLSSFACAVPGIMAARTIPSRADRLITILVAPLMSCSARLPVYTVLIGAFVPASTYLGVFSLQGILLLGLYLLGVIAAAAIAWIMKKTLLRGEPALFLMEMPRFKIPSLTLVLHEVWDRVLIFLKSAGTVILACSIVLWFLASYPRSEESNPEKAIQQTFAGQLGVAIEPVIRPLGYSWEVGVALIASFAAREVFVSSLATVYNLEDDDSTVRSLIGVLKERKEKKKGFGLPTALSLLVFYVFACMCMSTLAVCRRETGSWWWVGLLFVYMTSLAYGGAFVTYRLSVAWGL